MDIWTTLGIKETKDKDEIQAAYRRQLSVTNPEDSPEDFMALRAALEAALKAADQQQETGERRTWDNHPAGQWMKQVDEVYHRFSERINPQKWQALLQADICQNVDTKTIARDALLEYMLEHFFLPQSVLCVLNEHFGLIENMEELREEFPPAFLDMAIVESIKQKEYPPYEYFQADDSLPFEEYLRLSSQLNQCIGEGDTVKGRAVLKQMEDTGIRTPYFQIDKAKVCCQEENFQMAMEAIQELLPEYEDLQDVRLIRGDICFYLSAVDAAQEQYSKVLEGDPESPWARFGMAKCHVKNGNYKEANEIFSQLLQEDPYDSGSEEWLRECNMLYIEELEKRLAEKSSSQDLIFDLGWCYFQTEQYEKVLELLKDVQPEDNHRIEYHSLMGRTHLYEGHEELAFTHLKAWEQIVQELPDSEENRVKKEEQLPYVRLLQSAILHQQGDHTVALDLLDQILRQYPSDGEALRQKGQVLFSMWDFEGAAEALSKAIEAEENSHAAYLMRAKALYYMDYYGEAFDDCEKSLEIYPYELTTYVYKIKILIEAGEFDEAEEVVRYLESEELAGSELDFLKGYIEEGRGHDQEAERVYRKIISEHRSQAAEAEVFDLDNLAEVYHHLAVMLYDQEEEDFTPVVELIDKGLAEDENYVPLLEMKANVAQQCDKFQEALRLCERMLAIAPKKIGVYGMMDSVCRELEDWDKALEYANLQLKQNSSGYAYMRRGQIYTCLDRMDEAWEDFSLAVEMDPDLVYAYNYMGVILEYRGNDEEAVSYYQKAIAIGEREEEPCEEAYANAANLLCRRQEYQQAVDLLKRAYEETENMELLYEQIEIRRLAGQFPQAQVTLEEYRRAADLKKKDFTYNWELAHIFRDKGDLAEAYDLYDVEGIMEPAARREAAKILYYRGKYKKALKFFRKAIAQLDQEHEYEESPLAEADYFLWAGRTCLKLKDKKTAAAFAMEGLNQIPEDNENQWSHCLAMVYQTMGGLYTIAGDFDRAHGYLDKALQIRQCDYCNYGCCTCACYELGFLYEQEGRRSEAMEIYKKGQVFAPTDSDLSCAAIILENGKL